MRAAPWPWPRYCWPGWSAARACPGPRAACSQVLVIAAGVLVPVMYALGVIFAGFWILAILDGTPLPDPLSGAR